MMKYDATVRSQSYAISIEHILKKTFNCDRYGMGGIANSDFIRRHPFTAMFSALTYTHATASPEKQEEIEKFIDAKMFYSDMSIDYLLSFDSSSKTEGSSTIEISFDNGEEALKSIIEDFRQTVI